MLITDRKSDDQLVDVYEVLSSILFDVAKKTLKQL